MKNDVISAKLRIALKKIYSFPTSCQIVNFEVLFPVLWHGLNLSILRYPYKQSTIKITFWVFYTEEVLQLYVILYVDWWKMKTRTCPTVKGSWHLAEANLNWNEQVISTKLSIDTGILNINIVQFRSIPTTWLRLFLIIPVSSKIGSLFVERRHHMQKLKIMYIHTTSSDVST